jgi:hypothetical protein
MALCSIATVAAAVACTLWFSPLWAISSKSTAAACGTPTGTVTVCRAASADAAWSAGDAAAVDGIRPWMPRPSTRE